MTPTALSGAGRSVRVLLTNTQYPLRSRRAVTLSNNSATLAGIGLSGPRRFHGEMFTEPADGCYHRRQPSIRSQTLTEAHVEGGTLDAVQRRAVVSAVEHGLTDVRPVRALARCQRRHALLAHHRLRLVVENLLNLSTKNTVIINTYTETKNIYFKLAMQFCFH